MAGLWAVDLLGKRRLVTRVPGELELDDLSRDGRVLVAHHTMFGIQAGLAPGEKTERDLSWLDGSNPADLSPDGKTLLFNETAEGSGSAPSVHLRRTDGSPPVRLGEGTGIALSPDGNWVLASTNASPGKPTQLALLPTGPGQTRALKSGGFESFGAGAWIPDGKRIVFSATQAGHRSRLYVQDLSGEPKAISPEGVLCIPGMLSPDGRFAVGMEGFSKGSLYPLDGGEARPIAGLDGQPLGWSADGTVWLLDLSNGRKRPWLEIQPREPSLLTIFPLLLSRDGKSYVYGSRRVHSALYIIEGLR
jgi:dipeptidyl aminopeptidase/acylaminoacyl peptidase